MIGSHAFDYMNVTDKAMDASYQRMTLIANNLANADTPTYKRKDIDFQDVFLRELKKTQQPGVDRAVKHLVTDDLNPRIYTDYSNYSYRIDKNNVDPDTENVELASEQLRYQTYTTAMNQEIQHFKTAIGS